MFSDLRVENFLFWPLTIMCHFNFKFPLKYFQLYHPKRYSSIIFSLNVQYVTYSSFYHQAKINKISPKNAKNCQESPYMAIAYFDYLEYSSFLHIVSTSLHIVFPTTDYWDPSHATCVLINLNSFPTIVH